MPKLLVADADTTLHELYQQFFSKNGYDVETVSNGLECIERIRSCPPDVVCLDMEISCGGGEGVIAAMREYGLYASIPVVLIDRDEIEEGLLSHPPGSTVRRFRKPFRFSSLLAVLRNICPVEAEAPGCLS